MRSASTTETGQLGTRNGLAQHLKSIGTGQNCFVKLSGNQNAGQVRPERLDAGDRLGPIQSRHVQVDQNEMDYIVLHDLKRFFTIGRQKSAAAARLKNISQGFPEISVVVGNQ